MAFFSDMRLPEGRRLELNTRRIAALAAGPCTCEEALYLRAVIRACLEFWKDARELPDIEVFDTLVCALDDVGET